LLITVSLCFLVRSFLVLSLSSHASSVLSAPFHTSFVLSDSYSAFIVFSVSFYAAFLLPVYFPTFFVFTYLFAPRLMHHLYPKKSNQNIIQSSQDQHRK